MGKEISSKDRSSQAEPKELAQQAIAGFRSMARQRREVASGLAESSIAGNGNTTLLMQELIKAEAFERAASDIQTALNRLSGKLSSPYEEQSSDIKSRNVRRVDERVLQFLSDKPGELVPYDQIEKAVWGGTRKGRRRIYGVVLRVKERYGAGIIDAIYGQGLRLNGSIEPNRTDSQVEASVIFEE